MCNLLQLKMLQVARGMYGVSFNQVSVQTGLTKTTSDHVR